MSYILLFFDCRIDVSGGQNPVRVRTDAQIVDMIGNIGPSVRHIRRNNDNVARTDNALHDIITRDNAAARGTIQDLGDIAIGRRFPAVDDMSAGNERAATGYDHIGLSLMIMLDTAWKAAGRSCACLFAARLRLRNWRSSSTCSGTASAGRCCRRATMDDSDRLIELADIDAHDLTINSRQSVYGFDLSVGNVRCRFG